ncbi:MAG: VanZ family protein [Clostridium sp.]|nr:VanZ family protein [Clostridium sp.]
MAVTFAFMIVAIGLYIDLNPSYTMGGRQKLLMYATPIFVLFLDMTYRMRHTADPSEKSRIRRQAYIRMFLIYVIAAATLLFLKSSFRRAFVDRNIWEAEPFTREHFKLYCNLRPFRSISMYMRAYRNQNMSVRLIVANLLGNLVAAMPCAIFLPVIWPRRQTKWRYFLPTMILSVTAMEGIQFLTMVGQADIDDVILNVAGACLIFAYRPLLTHSEQLREWFL